MTPTRKTAAPAMRRAAEGGFVLVMALVFLVLLTLIGISSLNTTSLEEKMAHNIRDKNLALQSADSVVSSVSWAIQRPVITIDTLVPTTASGTDGLHSNITGSPTEPAWKSINWQSSSDLISYPTLPGGTPAGDALQFVASQPRYIVEQLSEAQNCDPRVLNLPTEKSPRCILFRVTARGVGGTAAAIAVAQGTVKKKVTN
jgi:type IV pilus assembly protein PilX